MTLSSLSVAAAHSGDTSSVNNLSRSPFQVDRDKARMQTTSPAQPVPVVPAGGNRTTTVPAGQMVDRASVPKAKTGAYNPWQTLTLQGNHLLSQDIAAWAESQGMHPLWNSKRDYLIYSTIRLTGNSRDDVLNQLGQLFLSENYGLVVRLYEKNNVLVIDGQ